MRPEVEPDRTSPDGVARTALWTAAARARESARDDRLFDDPYAEALAGPDGAGLLRHFHNTHASDEGNPFLAIRTRWFDDQLGLAAGSLGQIAGLGAGFDTRAYRLDWPPDRVLFELDQPGVLAYKAERLTGARARCDRRPVAVDFTADWRAGLAAAGHRPDRPTLWFAEGLLYYLPEQAARRVLREVAECSAPGSVLLVDLIGPGVFQLPYTRSFLRRLAEAGSPWLFGTAEPGRLAAECGWTSVTVTEPGQPGADFGRWPVGAATGMFATLPRSYLVRAVRAD